MSDLDETPQWKHLQRLARTIRDERQAREDLEGQGTLDLGAWCLLQYARRQRRRRERRLTVQDWDLLASSSILEDTRSHFRNSPLNPFSPRILSQLEEATAAVLQTPGLSLWVNDIFDEVPQLVERLTPAAVRATITAEVDRLQEIARDPVFLDKEVAEDPRGAGLVVQHRASGMRVMFIPAGESPGIVFAKPYKIDSIDPDEPPRSSHWWMTYQGLGIGQRVYLRGAELLPDLRWRDTSGADEARALRRKLHAIDPYTWHLGNCICSQAWKNFTRDEATAASHQLEPESDGLEPSHHLG
ncbi:hypothetical protein ACFVBP_10565 [Nocardioides sp. NPDC057764]|uniref:hypothetical protein n=1 Tax=Nocardioides sp. NPDC057764 TaxID=3346243 RepID=UPI00366EBDC9